MCVCVCILGGKESELSKPLKGPFTIIMIVKEKKRGGVIKDHFGALYDITIKVINCCYYILLLNPSSLLLAPGQPRCS